MQRIRLLFTFLALAGLVAGLIPGTLGAREIVPTELPPNGEVVVRLYYGDRARLDAVAGGLDIWEVHAQEGYVVAAVTPDSYQWLLDQGYRLEIDQEKTQWLAPDAPLDPQFYYYDDYYSNSNNLYWVTFLQNINTTYPDITELIDIGDAWGGLHGQHARQIYVLRITNEDPAFGVIADKPPFMIAPQAHAREVTTPEMAIRYIKYLTSGYNGLGGYGVDPDVTWLVDWNAAYIAVGMNPDGHWKNEQNTGANWRKNIDNDDGCPTGSYGTDLNRNFAFKWGCCGGSSGNCSSDTYRGPSRASEPETSALQTYFGTIFQDWNGANGDDEIPSAAPENTKGIFLSVHTYSDLVLWPWGFQSGDAPNAAQLQKLGRKEAYYLELNGANYTPQQAWDLYTTDGTSDDWTYGKYGIPSFTFEMGPQFGGCGGFFPAFNCMEGTGGASRNFWAEFRPTAVYMFKVARTPYITAYGPDAQNLTVTPNPVQQGTPVALTAGIQDHRSNGDTPVNIAGAEYFIDQPGTDGAGTAMTPQDGSWGGASETALATVATGGLSVGRHYILVHGKSATDNRWGPFTAIFLTVEESPGCDAVAIQSVTPQADGCVVDFSATLIGDPPFTYDWDFGAFGSSTQPTPTVDFGVSGTYPYSLTVTNCSGNDQDTYNGQVTVACCQAPSNAAFVFAPPDPTNGQTVVFTATASGTEPLTYDWDFGDGTTGSGAVVSHVYADGGDYTVAMTVSNSCGTQSVVHTVPVCGQVSDASFVFAPLSPEDGQTVVFTGTASGSEPLAYAWAFGDGATGNGVVVSHAYVAGGDYTAVLTVTNSCGTQSVENTVPVCGRLSGAAFTWSPVPAPAGVSITFDGTVQEGTDPIAYAWDFGDGSTGTGQSANHIYATAGDYTVVMTATNCTTGNAVATHVVTIVAAQIDVSAVPAITLYPNQTAQQVMAISDLGNYTLSWGLVENPAVSWLAEAPTSGDVPPAGQTDVTLDYTAPAAAGDYTTVLQITSNDPDDPQVDVNVLLHVIPVPPVCYPVTATDFGWTPAAPLIGEVITFTGSTSGTAPILYNWTFGDGGIGSGAVAVHPYAAAGTYTVTLTVENCDGDTDTAVHVITVYEEPPACDPVDLVSISQNVNGCRVTFTPQLTGDTPFTYLWAFGDGVTSTLALPTHTYPSTGIYNATVNVWNCAESGHDSLSFVVQVDCTVPPMWYLYLPVVFK